MSFFSELKRRNVFRAMVLYVLAGWVVLQAADVLVNVLPVPDWTGSLVLMLLLLGLPMVGVFAWVYEITPEGLKLESEVRREESITHKTARKLEIAIGVLAVLAIVIVIADRLIPEQPSASQAQTRLASSPTAEQASIQPQNSIAVLPFVDMSEKGDQEYFSFGLAEELLNLLARLPELKVASRTSSFSFQDKDVDVPTMASRLGVRYLLEGSVRRQDDKLRVTAQLIDAESNYHVWSDTYDRRVTDVFVIQDDIARNVVSTLKLVLSGHSDGRLANRSTPDFSAFESYLLGRELLRRPVTMTTLASAEALFEKAITIDPQYSEAFAGLCDTYLARYDRTSEVEFFEKAERACHRALTLDGNAADVYVALGNLYRLSGQFGKAEGEYNSALRINASSVDAFDGLAHVHEKQRRTEEARAAYARAIELQPGYWRGHQSLGNFLFRIGRSGEAIQHLQRAVDLTDGDPRALNSLGTTLFMEGEIFAARRAWQQSLSANATPIAYSNLGTANFFLGNFREAAELYKSGIELTPDDHQLWGALGDAYRFIPDGEILAREAYARAIRLAVAVLEINPTDAVTTAMLAHYEAVSGDTTRARELINRAEELGPEDMYVCYYAAQVTGTAGETEQALAYLERAVAYGYPAKLLPVDASFSALFTHERFRSLTGS